MRNDEEESKEGEEPSKGNRYITSRYGVMEYIEDDDRTSELAANRAAMDIRALQICHALGLEEEGQYELAIPLSGSRVLTHSTGVKRQMAHTDFEVTEIADEDFKAVRDASYGVIWTGPDPLPLIFWDHSHKFFQGPAKHSIMLAKVIPPRKIVVPPFSCVVLRGDVWHSGPADDDVDDKDRKKWHYEKLYRMHIYVGRQNMKYRPRPDRTSYQVFFPSVIALAKGFKPRNFATLVDSAAEDEQSKKNFVDPIVALDG